jgi:L-ascorbate metabolism protein UlaG (beta-lactamase superfamily)
MRFEDTVVLVDPWITRTAIQRDQEWQSDAAAVMDVVTSADYIFVTHSHIDHVADVPFIARRFGSKVVGSATTTNLALTAGVDASQLVTIQGGERLDFGSFSVEVVESLHDVLENTPSAVRTIDAPLGRPLRGGDFVEGSSYLYYFTFGSQRILDQGSGNFRMDRLAGLQPDLVLMVPNYDDYDLGTALTTLNPQWIIPHHWDAWRGPYLLGITDQNQGRARRFRRDAQLIIPQVGFTIPEYFQPLTLSGGSLRATSATPSVNPEQPPP